MRHITSRHNPHLREAAALIASSRERRKSGKCVLEGEHIVATYIERYGAPETLIVTAEALARPAARELAERHAGRTLVVPESLLAATASLPASVGLLAIATTPRPGVLAHADFSLLVDEVQDPGNVGSMLRSAAAAGVAQVLLSKHCAFAWSPKVLRAGQGAHFCVDIHEDVDLPAWARGFRDTGGDVVATVATGGTSLFAASFAIPCRGGHRQRRRRHLGGSRGLRDPARDDSDARRRRVAQRRRCRGRHPVRVRAPANDGEQRRLTRRQDDPRNQFRDREDQHRRDGCGERPDRRNLRQRRLRARRRARERTRGNPFGNSGGPIGAAIERSRQDPGERVACARGVDDVHRRRGGAVQRLGGRGDQPRANRASRRPPTRIDDERRPRMRPVRAAGRARRRARQLRSHSRSARRVPRSARGAARTPVRRSARPAHHAAWPSWRSPGLRPRELRAAARAWFQGRAPHRVPPRPLPLRSPPERP